MANCILAIDPATKLGWAVSEDYYGVLKLKHNAKDPHRMGKKLLQVERWLYDMHQLCTFDIIVAERPSGRHKNAIIHHAKIIACIQRFCALHNITFKQVSAKEVKKFATGNGNANKQSMIDAAFKTFNYCGNDDNEADALWILELAQQKQ